MEFSAKAPLVKPSTADAARSTRRRSMLSPRAPPISAPRTSGPSCAKLTAPTCREDRVNEYTWKAIATNVNWLPTMLTIWPANKRRKSRLSRNGSMSIRTRLAMT